MTLFSTNRSLLTYNTFGLEAIARYFTTFADISSLAQIIEQCKAHRIEFRVLGSGSNTLLTGDFRGAIIHPVSSGIAMHGDLVVAQAGVEWDSLVGWCVDRGLASMENLSYIPGSVGASPVQNIGAYGVEVGSIVEWVDYLDTQTMKHKRIKGSDCQFGYRDSIFKNELKNRTIITQVAYRVERNFSPHQAKLDYGDLRSATLSKAGGITLCNIRSTVTEIRQAKLPDPAKVGNAGSFFKNPVISAEQFDALSLRYADIPAYKLSDCEVKIPAAWLIERSGWKGFRAGRIGVHPTQALVIVNYGEATAIEILSLAQLIREDVASKFGIEISMEVNVL